MNGIQARRRKQKLSKRLGVWVLAAAMVATSISVPMPAAAQDEETENTRVNYALEGNATAQKSPIEYWGPDKLIDGIVNRDASKPDQSRWSSETGAPSWVNVDLTEIRKFGEINIAWEKGNVRKFHIEMSDDNKTYTTIYESEDAPEGHPADTTIKFNRQQFGRYIKITVDSLIEGAYPSVSIYEVEIIGEKVEDDTIKEFRANYALGADATASASPIEYWGPDKLTDGIINRNASKPDQSRWSSEAGAPQWVQIDLGGQKEFDEILIAWEAGGKIEDFHIEISDDGQDYTTVYDAEAKTDGYPADTTVYLDETVTGRYVKITADKMTSGAYPSVSIYEVKVIGTKVMNNLARKASVESNGDEADSVKVEYINDGTLEKRWGSSYGVGQKVVTFTYEEPQSIQSFILEWERKTPKDYKIEANVDGEWTTLFHQTKVPKTFQEIFNLDKAVETSQIRIVIDDFMTVGTDREGQTIDYPTVSLHEVEMYGEPYDFPPRDQPTTVQDIANGVILPPMEDGADTLPMPTVQDGYTIEFTGADYEQVIGRDRKIIKPIVDTTVVVNFEVTEEETGEKAFTPDIKVTVQGEHDVDQSINAKPEVLPELQQWVGAEGDFAVTDTSKIVVDPSAEEFMKAAETLAADYKDIMDKEILVVTGTDPEKGDFYFTKSNTGLEKETYYLKIDDAVTIEADQYTGAYWATRSILQILKQTNGTIAKGIAKDYPKYELRGMMLDVARLPVDMFFLEDLVKTMSWYKMNDFQIHLNDNVFTSTDGVPDYSGFRLESDVPNLTNTDVFFTKDQFRDFINNSKELGVNIVPEFDSPGHSGAFTRAHPEFGRGYGTENYEGEYLDLDNKFDEILEFMKGVFAEYTTGDNPVYPKGTVVHVGTDEYKRGNKENFRKYQDALLKYVRDDLGYTPRVWGSQTENNGTTPITVDGVQMNLWYTGYANPKDMYNLGYDLINTNDGDLYIVPGAGYYYDYLNQSHIYGDWQPNVVAGFKIPAGDEQMLGSNFCVWNDKTGPVNDNGTSDVELFDRIYHIMPTFGAKLWGDIKDYSMDELNELSAKTNYAPNSNPTYQVESVGDTYLDYSFNSEAGLDTSGNKYNLEGQKNVSYDAGVHGKALTLNGGESYVETPLEDIGLDTKVEFWVKKDPTDSNEEQILFESEKGAIKAVQKDTGKFGFSRWHRDYSFNYELPEDEWVHITLLNEFTKTKLYVNGEFVDELAREEGKGNKWASLITPVERIGSETHAFKGQIDDLEIYNKDRQEPVEEVSTTILEYALELAGRVSTDGVIQSVVEKFEAAKANAQNILDGVKAGNTSITQDQVDDAWRELIKAMQYLSFKQGDKQDLEKVIALADEINGKLDSYVDEGKAEFTTALEAAKKVYDDQDAMQDEVNQAWQDLLTAMANLRLKADKSLLNELVKEAEGIDLAAYTEESAAAFGTALADAKSVLADAALSEDDQDKVDAAVKQLASAKDGLKAKQASTGDVNTDNKTDKGGSSAADNNNNSADTKTTGEKTTEKSAKTGDTAQTATWMMLLAAAGSALVAAKKRKDSKE